MDFRQLQYMLKIAEEKSFSKAAKKLYISQPSLSQYVANIERQLGVQLFNRGTNPLTLTYAGELYIQTAQSILYLKDQLLSQTDDIANLKRGRIKIGISPFRSTHLLPGILPQFHEDYPGIDVILIEGTMSELLEMAINGITDFTIVTLPIPEDLLAYDPIMVEEILLAVPPKHDLAQNKFVASSNGSSRCCIDLALFKNEPFIFLKPGQRMHEVATDLCKAAGFKPKIILETKSIEAAHALVASGMGVAFIPATLVGVGKMQDFPTYYSIQSLQPSRTVVVAYRRGRYLSKAAQEFIAMTKKIFLSADSQ